MPDGIGDIHYSAPWYDRTGKIIEFTKFVILRDELKRLKQAIQNEEPDSPPIATPAFDDPDEKLAALFDPAPKETLEKMFPANGKWTIWADHAKANGLIDARQGRRMFNPYRAGLWFVNKGNIGWDLARLHRVLAKNLPARSKDEARLLTGDLD